MSQGLVLLDEAMELARQEKSALEAGEYEEAVAMAGKRTELTGMAWNFFSKADRDTYKKRLLELADLQKQLTAIASKAQAAVKESMNRSKLEQRRMRGYSKAVGLALQ